MGISRLTAFTIQGAGDDDLLVSHAGPNEQGKFSGWILLRNGRPLLNTESIFVSSESAEDHMRKVISDVRNMDMSAG